MLAGNVSRHHHQQGPALLEPYAQCLKLGQWHSHTTLAARAHAATKQTQLCEVVPRGGTGAAAPGTSTTHSSATVANHPTMAPTLGTIVFPLVPNFGIGNSTQDGNVIMGNAAMVPQALLAHATTTVPPALLVHNTAMVPSASPVYTTATVPQASSVNAAAMVPKALLANATIMVLEALSVYDTAPVPEALSVHTMAMVPQASLVNAATMVPQASSVNAATTVPQASSATALTSMDVDITNTSTLIIMEADEKATAKIYS